MPARTGRSREYTLRYRRRPLRRRRCRLQHRQYPAREESHVLFGLVMWNAAKRELGPTWSVPVTRCNSAIC